MMHLVIGCGALAGGFACMINPVEPLGAPLSMLEGSIFTSFLIPGIVLFVVFGIGNLVALIVILKTCWAYGAILGSLGSALIIWIVVQVLIIGDIIALHIIFFTIGLFQAVMGLVFLLQTKDFILRLRSLLKRDARS